jgi:hypothetical protein
MFPEHDDILIENAIDALTSLLERRRRRAYFDVPAEEKTALVNQAERLDAIVEELRVMQSQ